MIVSGEDVENISRSGNVWLLGLWLPAWLGFADKCVLAVIEGMNGLGAVPESGVVKKGVFGLNGPGENDEGAVSVNALFKDVALCEWKGTCRPR